MIKTRYWVIGIAAVFLLCSVGWIWETQTQTQGSVARVMLNGECIREIDLSKVTEGYEFTVEGKIGKNVIEVEKGRIRVREAQCPDQICVNQGWLDHGAIPIVCLPNQLTIQLEEDAEAAELDGWSK